MVISPHLSRTGSRRMQPCLEAALAYAHIGLPVFPVSGKIPYPGTHGFHDASTAPATILSWWRHWPDANVAIPTGKCSGWVVLDIDGRHHGFASFHHFQRMLRHRLPDALRDQPLWESTRTARTGAGLHLIFQAPEQPVRSTVTCAGLAGLDLRGEGGYIVVPPSLHPNGRHYTWLSTQPPVPFPPLLFDLLQQRERLRRREAGRGQQAAGEAPGPRVTAQRTDPDYWLAQAVRVARVGTRHRCALWLACRLIENSYLTPHQAAAYMQRYVELVPGGREDYPLQDALNCLQWAAAHV